MKYEVVWKFEPRRMIVWTPEEAYYQLGIIGQKYTTDRDEELDVERPPKEWNEATRISLYRLGQDPVLDSIAHIRAIFI